jgi:hypothetical protein
MFKLRLTFSHYFMSEGNPEQEETVTRVYDGGLDALLKTETGMTPEELFALDFAGRRDQLAKIGVFLQEPKPEAKTLVNKTYYQA